MKTITTSRNKTYPVTWAQVITRRNAPAQLVIELTQEQEAAQYAMDFDGLKSLKLVDDAQPGAYMMYEGFDRLTGMIRKDGAVRLTLERSETA